MNYNELVALWSGYFASPFPEGCRFFWKHYNREAVRLGFETLQRKLTNNPQEFASLSDATRYATGVMKNCQQLEVQKTMPVPETHKAVEVISESI